ncbi:MAG: GDP-L-fucose synthase [Pseudomonadota bacterium]
MRIFLAGHRGMVGSAILRHLAADAQHEVVTATHAELDLTRQRDVEAFIADARVDAVILAAARVGGIWANATQPADFIYDNLAIATNVIHAAHRAGVNRLLSLGSSCIYPRDAPQPIREEALMTGPLEPTNAPYAVAKIAALELCNSYNRQYGRDYRALMPTNLYGPGDNFHPNHAHVLPALIARFHEAAAEGAEEVTLWGTGRPRREFLHVNDLARAALFAMGLPKAAFFAALPKGCCHINVGTGEDITILSLAQMIAEVAGFDGRIVLDRDKPDGTPRKLLDVQRMSGLGWEARISLQRGIVETCAWYQAQRAAGTELRAS